MVMIEMAVRERGEIIIYYSTTSQEARHSREPQMVHTLRFIKIYDTAIPDEAV